MVALFSWEEIKKAAFGSGKKQIAGMGWDGISMAFYQDNWELLKNELEGVFKEFLERGILNISISKTFVCLIPKKNMQIGFRTLHL